jgi:hypothetical protein
MRRIVMVSTLAVATALSVMVPATAQAGTSAGEQVAAQGSWCGWLYGRYGGEAYHCRSWNNDQGGTYWGNWSAKLSATRNRDAVLQANMDGRVIKLGSDGPGGGPKNLSGRYERIRSLKFRVCEKGSWPNEVRHCGGWR